MSIRTIVLSLYFKNMLWKCPQWIWQKPKRGFMMYTNWKFRQAPNLVVPTFSLLGIFSLVAQENSREEITMRCVKVFISHDPSSKRSDSFGLQITSQEDLSTSEMKTENQLFLSPDNCNLSQNNSHYNQFLSTPYLEKYLIQTRTHQFFIVIVQLHWLEIINLLKGVIIK